MKRYWRLLKQLNFPKQRRITSSSSGFTLLELLVTALISGVVVSGLLYLTNELLNTDQRESNRTETQRYLQAALDYIDSELKEAVYVYENAACIVGDVGAKCDDGPGSIINVDQVDDLTVLAGTQPVLPVLAFWKQSPLTEELSNDCAAGTAPNGVPCKSGHAYSLVVYGYSENTNANGPWQGEAGIVRYEMGLTPDSLSGTDAEYGKYAAPNADGLSFPNWPKGADQAAFGAPQILIDFVDNFRNDEGNARDGYFGAERACPAGYYASPNDGGAETEFVDTLGGFYACVSDRGGSSTGSVSTSSTSSSVASYGYQDVILYLRGNANGRSGLMTEESFLPVLESRVLVRGSVNQLNP